MKKLYHESWYKNKSVLVTGGAGFIGSHLVERLVALGARVTVLDNCSTGRVDNLQSCFSHITMVHGDVCMREDVDVAMRGQDVVFHLAAFISVPQSIKHPQQCYATNVQGTCNVLEFAVAHHVAHVVFSSSSAVYGLRSDICDELTPTNPCSPYAESKLVGEQLCSYFSQRYGIDTTCLRYFNVYGERQNPQGDYAAVVAKFTHALRAHEPLIVYGDGLQTRDFVSVADVVQANLVSACQQGVAGEVFNIGSGRSISLLELIKELERTLHTSAASIVFEPARAGDIQYSQANCNKFLKMFYE